MRWRYGFLIGALILPIGAVFLEERQFVHEVEPWIARLRLVLAALVGLSVVAFTVGAMLDRERERGGWATAWRLVSALVLLVWGGFWCGLAELELFSPSYERTIHVAPDRAVHVYRGGWLEPDAVLYVSSGGIRQRRLISVHDCDPERVEVVGRTVTACRASCDLVTLVCQ